MPALFPTLHSSLPAPHFPYTGRLAPSPTGALHLGNARSFLLAWLDARQQGGRLVLRVEDLDSPRIKPQAMEQALEDLRWLGLDWDEGPIIQTHRLPKHLEALGRLRDAGLIYPCVCSRNDVLRAASAPHAGEEGPPYPGTCRNRKLSPSDGPVAWRMVCPSGGVTFHDHFVGPQAFDVIQETGDFVVARKSMDFSPAYQLAVVWDDANDKVTTIIRGDDLLPSTARQILVSQALKKVGYDIPLFTYCHVPLVVGPDGRRLAKRHGDTRLSEYRRCGVPAGRVLALLAEWVGAGVRESFVGQTADSILRYLLSAFRWENLSHQPILFTHQDDEWLRTVGKD